MLLLLALLAAAPTEPTPEPSVVVFHGNVVLPDSVFLATLDLPHGTKPSAALARSVQRRLRSFLKRSGYDLSSVEAEFDGSRVLVDIDEGRLDKVVFLGEGVLETVRLKLELDLPGRVFNRDLVERRLAGLARAARFESWRWELVPVENPPLPQAQLDQIQVLRGLPFLQPGRPYELFIYVKHGDGGPGWSPEIEIDSLEGGGVGAEYRAEHGPSFGGRVAGAVRNYLTVPGSRVVLTRGWFEGRYAGPHLFGVAGPQSVLRARFDYQNRQRADLHLEGYEQVAMSIAVAAVQKAGPYARLGVGLGLQRRFLFNLAPVAPLPMNVTDAPRAQNRLYGDLSVDLDLTPQELRRDRHATASFAVRLYPSIHEGDLAASYLRGSGQWAARSGWHEWRLRASGTALGGGVPFFDEEPLAAHLHGPFGGVFARKVVTVGGEFGYSLWRDLFKVGPYLEGLAYGDVDRATGRETAIAGAVTGLVASGLFFDQFVFETYVGLGMLADGRAEGGLAIALRQAY